MSTFTYNKVFYYNLQATMRKYGITQSKLADIAKTTQTTISNKFRSGEPFNMLAAYKIWNFFKTLEYDISFEWLFFDGTTLPKEKNLSKW